VILDLRGRTNQMDQNTFSVNNTAGAEIGDDPRFENTWSRFARINWVLLAIFTVLGGAGLFGKGPLAHASVGTPTGPLYVKYERYARYQTPSILHLSMTPAATVHDGTVRIFISQPIVEAINPQKIDPQPSASVLSQGGEILEFKAKPGSALTVELVETFQRFGTLRGHIALVGQTDLAIRQIVYP
jgi:hypothetical protein